MSTDHNKMDGPREHAEYAAGTLDDLSLQNLTRLSARVECLRTNV